MNVVFYLSAAIAVITTGLAISRANAVHGILYLVVSLLSLALVFFTLGAPFVAALEVIIYAGAIVVLFVFVVMMLNLGPENVARESRSLHLEVWLGPGVLAALLLGELIFVIAGGAQSVAGTGIEPKQVGITLFGPYLLGVEMASVLLLAGMIGAFHLGQRDRSGDSRGEQE